ncbi:serine/threonine-protein kinase [Tothia fuscella]|uniref:Serine/threonine-protein kinase n=1 Tax=Tothia fuscella TaxID=1048955 RepID=A0A9P4NFM6_9PEZI|nr:serine/threonine-protein kinase [Tothia fuscella]
MSASSFDADALVPTVSSIQGRLKRVLESSEIFEEVDGVYAYTGTLIVYQAGKNLYHGRMICRSSLTEIRIEDATNITLIPTAAYRPLCPPTFTQASSPSNCFVKRPGLISYDRVLSSDNPYQIAEQVLQECQTCEFLKKHPHPNIAECLGCEIQDKVITGICFTRYPQTLMRRVNLGSDMKRSKVLQGIENGIRHLHQLNLVHNDLNPSNVMLLNDDTPIIIDFDSCRRTYEWYDEDVQISLPSNDLDALGEMREWLSENVTKQYQFKE